MWVKMGNRYSKEESSQIESLVAEGLTNREIASKLGRSEAAVRNLRYRTKLQKKTRDDIGSLSRLKEKLESEIGELNQTKTSLSNDVRSLEERKEHLENLLTQESTEKKMEDKLMELKLEKPELFYISGEEQIAKLAGYFVKWLIS